MKTGAELIAEERQRQIEGEGWDSERDDEHTKGELAMAAVCYAAPRHIYTKDERATGVMFFDPWPWEERYDKRYRYGTGNTLPNPSEYSEDERLDFLIKAGALIAAEIDRLQRSKD